MKSAHLQVWLILHGGFQVICYTEHFCSSCNCSRRTSVVNREKRTHQQKGWNKIWKFDQSLLTQGSCTKTLVSNASAHLLPDNAVSYSTLFCQVAFSDRTLQPLYHKVTENWSDVQYFWGETLNQSFTPGKPVFTNASLIFSEPQKTKSKKHFYHNQTISVNAKSIGCSQRMSIFVSHSPTST